MASALAARIRAALAPLDQPGPEIGVSPFRAGEVSGGAIALKGLATLMAGRRAAANSRARQAKVDADARYRALLSQQLEQKVATPAEPTQAYKLPDGTMVNMTPKEYATHYGTFHPKEAPAAKRTPIAPGLAQKYAAAGFPFQSYDPKTNTVDDSEWMRTSGAYTQQNISSRLTKALNDRRTRSMVLDEARLADRGLKLLDEREKEIADDALVRGTNYAEAAKRILLSTNADPRLKAKASKALGGIPFARGGTSGTDLLYSPESGNKALLYDTSAIDAAVKNAALKFQRWKVAQVKEMNRPQRESYIRRFQLGGQAEGEDSLNTDFLDRLQQGLSAYGAPAAAPAEDDSTYLDAPAAGPETAGQRANRYYRN